MMQWMNEARASHGVRALASDGSIHHVALGWTDRMVQRQDLSHNPDYGPQIFAARPEATTAGENVGRGTGTQRGLFDAFMASSGHRAKILGSQYSHATVACVVDAGGQLWVTMNFWG